MFIIFAFFVSDLIVYQPVDDFLFMDID